MKKVLISAAAFAAAFSVSAGDMGASADHHAFNGFYFGIGPSISNYSDEVWFKEANYKNQSTDPLWITGEIWPETKGHITNIGGHAVFGFGKPVNTNMYLGLEIGSDFYPIKQVVNADKLDSVTAKKSYSQYVQRDGMMPFAAFRIGHILCGDKMVYLKVGASYAKTKEKYDYYVEGKSTEMTHAKYDKKSIMPLIALGMEKPISQKGTVRAEIEYRFGKKWTKNFTEAPVDPTIEQAGTSFMKLKQKGSITVRVMFCHNVKV